MKERSTRLVWHFDLERRFCAPAELLDHVFATRVGDYGVSVQLPSVGEGKTPYLSPPFVRGEANASQSDGWGMVYESNQTKPVAVVVDRLQLTADVGPVVGQGDLEPIAESIVSAMDDWWGVARIFRVGGVQRR